MEIPVLMTDVPPVRDLAEEGAITLIGEIPLAQQIAQVFADEDMYRRQTERGREVYLSEFSYAVNADRLWASVSSARDVVLPPPASFESLLAYHAEVFGTARQLAPVRAR
jgi:hypothetical protein